jgi:hypothetical protein
MASVTHTHIYIYIKKREVGVVFGTGISFTFLIYKCKPFIES